MYKLSKRHLHAFMQFRNCTILVISAFKTLLIASDVPCLRFSYKATRYASQQTSNSYEWHVRFDMAENKEGEASGYEKSVQNVEKDPRLDFYSAKFDPLFALRVNKLKVPNENAKVYDNLSSYTAAISQQDNPRPKKEKKIEISEVELTRRWLPEQSMCI